MPTAILCLFEGEKITVAVVLNARSRLTRMVANPLILNIYHETRIVHLVIKNGRGSRLNQITTLMTVKPLKAIESIKNGRRCLAIKKL